VPQDGILVFFQALMYSALFHFLNISCTEMTQQNSSGPTTSRKNTKGQ